MSKQNGDDDAFRRFMEKSLPGLKLPANQTLDAELNRAREEFRYSAMAGVEHTAMADLYRALSILVIRNDLLPDAMQSHIQSLYELFTVPVDEETPGADDDVE